MGTRSRIVIRRSKHGHLNCETQMKNRHIYLWMAYDGYLEGQGNELCKQLAYLLSVYSTISLQAMVEALDIKEFYEGFESQEFSAEYFADFVMSKVIFKNDPCDDIEYEYIVDFEKGLLLVKYHNEKTFVVTFSSIQDGFLVSELESYLEDD